MATDVDAREYLQSRGVKAAPVTIVDDEVIIGYYPKKLLPALKLDVRVDLGSNTEWLAGKYDRILGATIRAAPTWSSRSLGVLRPLGSLSST